MMKYRMVLIAAVILFLGIAVMPIAGQGLPHELIDFTISAPFKLNHSRAELPAGKYVLRQLTQDTFGLYADGMMHPPVAMISTIPRYDYLTRPLPGDTHILLDRTVLPEGQDPVLEGWTVPDGEGWDVVGVVTNHKQLEAINGETRSTEQRGAQ
jgi:hypothetical protein